ADSFLEGEERKYTLPDLHGNALKLLNALIITGAITMSNDHYKKFVHHYFEETPNVTQQNLSDLRRLISGLSVPKKVKKHTVRFIGDELGDRGSNDYYTLLIIRKLANLGIKCEFIISNHSFEFIQGYETGIYMPVSMPNPYAFSLISLGYFLSKKLVSQEEVRKIVEEYYKPKLKILSYSVSNDQTTIIIYTHAPAGLDQIRNISRQFGIEYKDETISDLSRTIDKINDIFQKKYVTNNLVHTIRDYLDDLIWNRNYNKLDRPENYNGYKVKFVHGHDPGEESYRNIYNLDFDNNLGKSCHDTAGKHQIFVSK
ncbi:MAG: hypothetical protein WCN27_03000, partial [Alphaproteobacteria bacterium]